MSASKRNELRECFELLDSNHNGTLEFDELITALNVLEVSTTTARVPPSLPHQLAHALTRSRTHARTRSLARSRTHSLR